MVKIAKILIVLSVLTLAGSGVLYLQHVGEGEPVAGEPVTGAKTPVYAGIAGATLLLLGLVMLNLDTRSAASREPDSHRGATDGTYDPYGDEEFEDEYEDEEVY